MKLRVLVLAMTTVTAYAHHALDATYDLKKEVKIEGKIVGFLLRNPHSFVQIRAADQDGIVQVFSLEWGSANSLAKRGIKAGVLKNGDDVIVTWNPSRRPSNNRGVLTTLRRQSDGLEWDAHPQRKHS